MPGLHVTTFGHENHAQDASKTPPDAQKGPQDGPRNLKEAHKMPPRRFQDGPRRPQGASKTLPGRLQNGSKTAPRRFCLLTRPKTLPRCPQDAPRTLPRRRRPPFKARCGGCRRPRWKKIRYYIKHCESSVASNYY